MDSVTVDVALRLGWALAGSGTELPDWEWGSGYIDLWPDTDEAEHALCAAIDADGSLSRKALTHRGRRGWRIT